MKLSSLLAPTLREAPAEAEVPSHTLMLRAGLIRKLAAGIYEWLPMGLRVLHKVEQIIREEMNRIGGQEVWLPAMQPRELWEESGRWGIYGKELMRLKDRHDREFCLGPTHEEVITDLVRREVRSYRQIPLLLYQFQTKFRDEIRPRFGIMRAREFYMKDGYSFDADEPAADKSYEQAYGAYVKIFERCGLKTRPVEAETGTIGGSFSHEFMVLADTGEEGIASCSGCGYAANVERAECAPPDVAVKPPTPAGVGAGTAGPPLPLEEVSTPGMFTVDAVSALLKLPATQFIKTMLYLSDGQPVTVLVRGDTEVNEHKLQRTLGARALRLATRAEVDAHTGGAFGFSGPVGRKDRIIADDLVKTTANAVSGANQKDVHLKNINPGRDFQPERYADLRVAQAGDLCPKCRAPLEFTRGIEVGHTFKLGTKYSQAMKATFLDAGGAEQPFIMGCYGIGVSRVVASVIEQHHDQNGIIWPASVAPFQVVIVPVKREDPAQWAVSENLYAELTAAGLDVLLDDRSERAGVKFKDADLYGIPVRVTVSDKTLAAQEAEVKRRSAPAAERVPLAETRSAVTRLLGSR